jgi:hypothetical protein
MGGLSPRSIIGEDHVAPVAVFGASNRIPKDVLPHFAGKRVRIFQHDDDPGRNAGALCAEQLMATGVEVDGYSFAGPWLASKQIPAAYHGSIEQQFRCRPVESYGYQMSAEPRGTIANTDHLVVKPGISALSNEKSRTHQLRSKIA